MNAIEIFNMERIRKHIGYVANGREASSESSIGSSITGKKFVTKKKDVKKRHAQKLDSDSKVDNDWIDWY